jgi:hypothetical protein
MPEVRANPSGDTREDDVKKQRYHFRRRGGKLEIIWPKRRPIDDETREVSWGCLSLNVSLARGHGWSEKQLDRVHDQLAKIAKKESRIAGKAHPERFEDEHGVSVFVGEIDLWGNWIPPGAFKKRGRAKKVHHG